MRSVNLQYKNLQRKTTQDSSGHWERINVGSKCCRKGKGYICIHFCWPQHLHKISSLWAVGRQWSYERTPGLSVAHFSPGDSGRRWEGLQEATAGETWRPSTRPSRQARRCWQVSPGYRVLMYQILMIFFSLCICPSFYLSAGVACSSSGLCFWKFWALWRMESSSSQPWLLLELPGEL